LRKQSREGSLLECWDRSLFHSPTLIPSNLLFSLFHLFENLKGKFFQVIRLYNGNTGGQSLRLPTQSLKGFGRLSQSLHHALGHGLLWPFLHLRNLYFHLGFDQGLDLSLSVMVCSEVQVLSKREGPKTTLQPSILHQRQWISILW